jgi:hypothetical protein
MTGGIPLAVDIETSASHTTASIQGMMAAPEERVATKERKGKT